MHRIILGWACGLIVSASGPATALPLGDGTFQFGYGAGVDYTSSCTSSVNGCPSGPFDRDEGRVGGDGIGFASTGQVGTGPTAGNAWGTIQAYANARDARLGVLSTAAWTGPSAMTRATFGSARGVAELFDTYTLTVPAGVDPASIDPAGLTVTLDWFLDGGFSYRTPGANNGGAQFRITLHDPAIAGKAFSSRGLVLESFGSGTTDSVNAAGTVNLSQAWYDLTGDALGPGDSFILDLWLDVRASPPPTGTLYPAEGYFSSGFLNTAGIGFTISGGNVDIVSAANVSTVPLPPAWLSLGMGAMLIGWLGRRGRNRPSENAAAPGHIP